MEFLPRLLFFFGVGFLVANLKVVADLIRFRVRKSSALLTWQRPKPRFYGFSLLLAGVLGLLVVAKLIQRRPPIELFGEAMMLIYYGYAFPLSTRIARGFYRDGVWADTGFLRWAHISAVTWKEEGGVTLILISRLRSFARRLEVPGTLYGEARRVLRDKIRTHDIRLGGAGLDLGSRDESDAV
ncbi:MAG: hypothetical protein ACRD26_07545 [Vicinamibacterales bacterium]